MALGATPDLAPDHPDERGRDHGHRLKVVVWVPEEKLRAIDAAADRLGQRRSPFMLQAALRLVEALAKA